MLSESVLWPVELVDDCMGICQSRRDDHLLRSRHVLCAGKGGGKKGRAVKKPKAPTIDIDEDVAMWNERADDDFDYDAEFAPLADAEEDPLLATVLKRCHGMVVRLLVCVCASVS